MDRQKVYEALAYLVSNPDKCDELLRELDTIAKSVDVYDFGLPINNDGDLARLRQAILVWVVSIKE